MKYFILASLTFMIISCNSSTKTKEKTEQTDSINADKTVVETYNITAVKINTNDVPAGLNIKGKVQQAWRWTDKLGENLLITSYVAPYDDKRKNQFGEEGQTSELYAYHYAKKDKEYVQVWSLNDGVIGCPFDITNNFIADATTVTDLDNNGIAEIKLQYLNACRSDVSPAALKLVMFENGIKHTLTGLSWLAYSPELKFEVTETTANLESLTKAKDENDEMVRTFGRYESEKDFANTPGSFLKYARTEWIKFVKEKIGE